MGRGKEFRGYFCPEQGLSALNFRGGAEKVVVPYALVDLVSLEPLKDVK